MKRMFLFAALLISLPSFAQDKVPAVRLGNITTATATCDQVLSFPRLLIMNPTCVVKSFKISLSSKGGEVSGPFYTEGPALTDAEIALIKKNKGTATKIIIEDIKSSCQGGPETTLAPIVLTYN